MKPAEKAQYGCFKLQNVMTLQLLKVNFEQNIEGEHECALAFVHARKATSPMVGIPQGKKWTSKDQ